MALDREWPGCPTIWVGTSRDLGAHLGHFEKLDARKLWADFSVPNAIALFGDRPPLTTHTPLIKGVEFHRLN